MPEQFKKRDQAFSGLASILSRTPSREEFYKNDIYKLILQALFYAIRSDCQCRACKRLREIAKCIAGEDIFEEVDENAREGRGDEDKNSK